MKITLKLEGKSSDGKRIFISAEENDGWEDVRIEIDSDDCDSKYAMKAAKEIIRRCNSFNE